jgi:uncharacterized membrane protein
MKIRFFNSIITIEILTIILVLAITFIPSSPLRIVIGLPFILFFPGYTLVSALFPREGTIFGKKIEDETGGIASGGQETHDDEISIGASRADWIERGGAPSV